MKTRIAAIIPARMASTRFPNKPLLEIEGLPMIEHVRRRALLCKGFAEVVVATCDEAIAFAVKRFDGKVVMTSDKHCIATERIVEAAQHLDCTHVVNVQGDEILLVPSDLEKMLGDIMSNPKGPVWNAIAPLTTKESLRDSSMVKCVVSQTDHLLFCSRNFSTLPFKGDTLHPVFLVVGILAYHRSFLERIPQISPTPLEMLESIEQSRFLENDIPIRAVRFEKAYPGINTPQEAEAVKRILKEDPIQRAILKEIL
ncbi:MAG: hypothetical protein A2W61_06315 [Deltaproteobacteria bacterium RIFCSPLOWO2_01_44_7]|nr:MAG: hypothetical protein A2712_02815 [Deltaproteobacteria bacterium RIFCSPHIGHO2_01_FULL_43_49]OGQ16127.1 MAG: hypothetical protein A3D22_00785 [Deltaproteobacteria bacterium RIFCSPHIGHO2_02_FULL_44_53]OGQ29088.1 MAG: hypothetical protein A3D98_04570 [Deltaproteobacteria bacterium RIFCSPHIGHO2_12_FULL_44_21]OGQ32644.1 MAG: hypothetical protein A2979_08715 [Deltaproteobacteria bacterium RIFCSPLOWO2_01_FULL_45_74]OGQ38030.1 MAG: hypothetical protein A2W61_06315 [Deltaproteobacteria bacterium 